MLDDTQWLSAWSVYSYLYLCVCVCSCHYGACELPSVAALIGGVAAQEVIKVITGQFVPLNNTFIYNAIKQTSVSLDL